MQKAIDYILDNPKELTHFTGDPRLLIDNIAEKHRSANLHAPRRLKR